MNSTPKKISLTKNQQQITNLVKEFAQSENDVFVLTGAAGTGKTTIIKEIIKEVEPIIKNIYLLAPTNRAAKVLSKKTEILANTIHSEIYYLQDIKNKDGVVIASELLPKYLKLSFNSGDTEDLENQTDLYIVDESSMISAAAQSEGALISKNSLLENLYKHVKYSTPNSKILFVGDSYQLPPIGHEGISPALNISFLKKYLKTDKIQHYELHEVLRQKENSPILDLANDIKQKIDLKQKAYWLELPNKIKGYNNFIKEYCDKYSAIHLDKTIALGWTRKDVLQMNLDIRKHLYGLAPQVFEVGDIVYVNSKWDLDLESIAKGEIGTVVQIHGEKEIIGKLMFHTVSVEFSDLAGNSKIIKTKVLSDYAYSSVEYLPKEMFIKLAIERSKVNDSFRKSGDSHDDVYMNALQLKFAYALTVHKAQGGEWDNVYLHSNTNWRDLRWNYTAVTRASKNLYSFKY